MGKRVDQKRRSRPLSPARRPSGEAPGAEGKGSLAAAPRRAIRVSRVKVPSLTTDEAVLVLARQGEAFVLFRDVATSRLRVLHRRKDGLLGVLEPEV